MKLKEICEYISDRVAVIAVSEENYISTENMAQNKGGVTRVASLPSSGAVIRYKNDDILISNIRPYFKKIWQADKNGGCSADVLCIRAKEHIDSTFLYYLLSQDAFFEYVMTGTKGCKMPRGDKSHIMDWDIDIPEDKSEQTAIGQCLKVIDKKIEINKQINDNLEQQASFLFQDWLSNCNSNVSIRELAENVLDYTQNKCEQVYLLNSSDVTEGRFSSLPLVSNKNLKGQFKKRFKKGDILYSEIRPRNRHYAYCYFDADRYIASTRLIILRAKPDMLTSSTVLYQYLMLNSVFEEFTLKTESRSGTFPQGNYEDLSSIRVPYSANQEEIAKSLEAIYEQLWNNLKENERLEALRDSLLPKLMSGELKINKIDC